MESKVPMNCKTTICICIVLLVVQVQGDAKKCTLIVQQNIVPREIWNQMTGFYCYQFTNDFRLYFRYNTSYEDYHGTKVPIIRLENGTGFTYDYLDEIALSYIKRSFRTDHFFKLWKSCCQEAAECCDNFMTNENIIGTEEYPCPAIWDGWSCFGPTKAGTTEKIKCSKQVYSTDSDVCELMSEKECFTNGTWKQQTNYEVCAIAPVLRKRHIFNVIVLAVALAFCFPAVAIFFSFRTLRAKTQFIMHRNLILIIIIRNILTIMSKEIVILDALKSTDSTNNVMVNNGVACRVLAFFENAAKNGMFACMLADGFYLHKLIVRAFANEPKIVYLYGVVSVLTLLPSLIWAIARGVHNGTDCWMVDETQDQWISDGFRIAILVVNFIFLLDIIRVMILKLKHSETSQHTKATLRATLFLIPLFGVHIVIITNRNIVPSNECAAEDIYYYISYSIEGLQGIMVALLFCYMSSEVIGEIKNFIRKLVLSLQQKFGTNFSRSSNFPRNTTATYVDPNES